MQKLHQIKTPKFHYLLENYLFPGEIFALVGTKIFFFPLILDSQSPRGIIREIAKFCKKCWLFFWFSKEFTLKASLNLAIGTPLLTFFNYKMKSHQKSPKVTKSHQKSQHDKGPFNSWYRKKHHSMEASMWFLYGKRIYH